MISKCIKRYLGQGARKSRCLKKSVALCPVVSLSSYFGFGLLLDIYDQKAYLYFYQIGWQLLHRITSHMPSDIIGTTINDF